MTKARTLADFVADGNEYADGVIDANEVDNLATVATSGSYNDLADTPTPYTNGKAIAMATIFGL